MQVSEIGFGAWAIGGGAMIGNTAIGWGDVDDAVSIKAINAARDAGINFFDTADIYGLGHSEELLGKTIANSKEILVATKVGNVSRNNLFTVDYSKNHILNACEASLRRLRREVIDFYQLHTARLLHLQNGECIEAMMQLQQQGKIRDWGISLNTFDPLPVADFFIENKKETGYGIIVRMALQFGLLTGKFDKEITFSDNDHRKKRLTREIIDAANESLSPVWELCEKYQCSKTQLALSYVLSYPEVSTLIAGIRTSEQVHQNTTGLFRMKKEDMEKIEEWGKTELLSVFKMIQKQG